MVSSPSSGEDNSSLPFCERTVILSAGRRGYHVLLSSYPQMLKSLEWHVVPQLYQAWAHTIIGIIWHIFEIRWLCHMKWDTSLKFKKYILWNVIHLWNTKSFSNEMWYTFEIQILCHMKCDTLLKFKLLVG